MTSMREIREVNVKEIFWNFPSIDDSDNTTRKFSRTVLYKQMTKFMKNYKTSYKFFKGNYEPNWL